MKRLLVFGAMTTVLLTTAACNKDMGKITERMDAMEKRLEQLEKRPTFPARQMPPEQTAAYNLPVGNSYFMGKKDAQVSLVIFSDYQCPFCAKTDPLMQDVMKDPELKNKVNVVFKHFPLQFHPNAKPAAKAALAAGEQGNDKFWSMTAKLYENQRDLTPDNFKKWAKEIGLNTGKFETDMKSNDTKYEEMIKADMELGIKEAKVRGTPSIFVCGWELKERSVDGIKELIKDKKCM